MLIKRCFLEGEPSTPSAPTTPAAPVESAPTPAASTAPTESAPAPAPIQTPAPSESAPAADSQTESLKAQVEALHSELQVWKLKSSMSERRIVPQDSDLVSRLVLEMVSSSGKSIDQCVSDLYSSKPYLFKIPKEDTKRVENKSPEVDNKRLIEGAIARLGRAKITL